MRIWRMLWLYWLAEPSKIQTDCLSSSFLVDQNSCCFDRHIPINKFSNSSWSRVRLVTYGLLHILLSVLGSSFSIFEILWGSSARCGRRAGHHSAMEAVVGEISIWRRAIITFPSFVEIRLSHAHPDFSWRCTVSLGNHEEEWASSRVHSWGWVPEKERVQAVYERLKWKESSSGEGSFSILTL